MGSNPGKNRSNNVPKEESNSPFKAEKKAQINHPRLITSTIMFRLS